MTRRSEMAQDDEGYINVCLGLKSETSLKGCMKGQNASGAKKKPRLSHRTHAQAKATPTDKVHH